MTSGATSTSEAPWEQRRFGRYTLRRRLAHGGMATVYLAQLDGTQGFRKTAAVKVIHPHLASDPRFVQMFLNEARLSARLEHPNVCSVFDCGEADGTPFMAMEYLHGETLGAVVAAARDAGAELPLAIAARIVADAAIGLHAAHELRTPDGRSAEVVHRDVSPQNVFVLYDGVTKVVDFGIARSNEHAAERTETGHVRGKLAYMAPEQLRREAIDRRVDVFALGVVLWEVTTLARLFRRNSDVETIAAVLSEPIPPPSSRRADYPAALEAVVMKALAREPAQRFATAAEMARALERFVATAGEPASALAVSEAMHALFAERVAQKRAMLQRAADASPAPAAAVAPTPPVPPAGSEDPTRAAPLPHPPAAAPRGESTPSALDRAPTRRARAAAVSAALVATMAAGAWALRSTLLTRGAVAPVAAPAPRTTAAALAHAQAPAAPRVDSRGAPASAAAPPQSDTEPMAPAAANPATESAPARQGGRTASHGRAGLGGEAAGAGERGTGRVNVVAVPTAAVREGGRVLGFTPLIDRALPAGRHVLRLTPTDGHGRARVVVVTVRAGATESVSVRWP